MGDGGIESLHSGCAVAHDRPARHLQSTAHAQSDDAPNIDLVGRWARAAENHFVQLRGRKRHAREQRTARLYREIRRRKRARLASCLEKRRTRPVDNIDRLIHRSLTLFERMLQSQNAGSLSWFIWLHTDNYRNALRLAHHFRRTREGGDPAAFVERHWIPAQLPK